MKLIWIFITVGGLIGGYIPVLFGQDGFSLLSILGSLIGSILGIWLFVKLDIE